MPAACARAGLIWCAFLHNAPRCYAVLLTPDQARRLAQKYGRQYAWIADAITAHSQASAIALVAWFAVRSPAHLLPLARGTGGIAALHTHRFEAPQGDLWNLSDFCLCPGMPKSERGTSPFPVAGRNPISNLSSIDAGIDSNAALHQRDNRV